MWLLILAGLLAVSASKETVSSVSEKAETSSGNADDIVMLEIDVKEPAKRSPIQDTSIYGTSQNQYILGHGDEAQELSPDYLPLVQAQYAQHTTAAPQSRPLPAYAKQQQSLQQAYYNFRKPTVVPPRPRVQYNSQALARAEAAAEIQAQIDTQEREEALRLARLGGSPTSAPTHQIPSYSSPKLGTFEQELLQLVSANQAQEFKLLAAQPKDSSSYSQQLGSYPAQYAKPSAASAPQLPEQYHIETSPPRYHQPQAQPAYQPVQAPIQQVQYQSAKTFKPSPQYDYVDDSVHSQQNQAQAEAEALAKAQAQAQANAQALAFQKISLASSRKHQEKALEQIRLANEAYKQQQQQSALEQIQHGTHVSDAGRAHLEEQFHPKTHEEAYKAGFKAEQAAQVAAARRQQEAAEYKAHADAIRKHQAEQQAHLRVQEQAHQYALNFEKHQARAQELAQAQADALYKVYRQNHIKNNNKIVALANAQAQAKKQNPGASVIQYVLPENQPLPSLNNYYNDEHTKYQSSGSSYAPRSVPKTEGSTTVEQEQAYIQPLITQPKQTHKLKLSASPQSSVYVSQSGLLKKSPIKSLTIEEVAGLDQVNNPPVVRLPAPKGHTITEEELSALINAGYTVTPVPETAKPTQQSFTVENSSAAYYAKKQKNPAPRPEYVTYEEILQRPRRPLRKTSSILKQDEGAGEASEKVTYLVPLEPTFGTRQPSLRRQE